MILQYPNEILHKVSCEVKDFSEAEIIAKKLIDVTSKVDKFFNLWIGMAAPQIGYNKRIILLKESKGKYKVIINPEIIETSRMIPTISKCFSVKGIYLLKNPLWIKLKYQDLMQKSHLEIFKGGKAVILQQELDHLNGILIPDRGLKII